MESPSPCGFSVPASSSSTREAFLTSQYAAQRHHYLTHYSNASFQVILQGGQPAGRLYVARWEHEIRIMDVAVLPEHRNAGIGSALIKALQEEAGRDKKSVTIHVEMFNRAARLYERLGFCNKALNGVYWLMEWTPPSQATG
ncbi:MAG TPA: GNAT family N-acetyltransferase [Chloroflexota bacterium]|nr:GNAT family N-acetyltransferase [Chloroflexota bacterium]